MRKYLFMILFLSVLYSQNLGITAFPLLRISFGARASALGESFCAVTHDANSMWYNPGSMGFSDFSEFFGTYHIWFQGFRDYYAGINYATRKGIFGGGIVYSSVGDIEGWNEQNYPTKNITQSSFILLLSYARRLHPFLAMGISFKYLNDRIGDYGGNGFAFDLGANYQARKDLNIGGVVKNIGPSMKYGKSSYSLPSEGRFGIKFGPFYNFNFISDISYVNQTGLIYGIGLEYWLLNILALRLGYKEAHQENNLTFGIGLKYQGFKLDYTFAGYGVLGSTHRIWFSREFGKLIPLGNLIVKVIDAKTKEPLLAKIKFGKPVEKEVHTDSVKGTYLLKDVPVGEIGFTVSNPEYYPKKESAKISEGFTVYKIVPLERIPYARIYGRVLDAKTEKPLPSQIIYKGPIEGETSTDTLTGLYNITQLKAGEYTLTVKAKYPGYEPAEAKISLKPGDIITKDFKLLKKGEVILLKGVNFETGKATLVPEAYPILDEVGRILKENPKIKVEIAGHTDNVPIHTKEFPSNLELSQARAEAVKNYLVEKWGIEPERLIAKGYGDTQPIADNRTPEGRAKNRRVEFRILK